MSYNKGDDRRHDTIDVGGNEKKESWKCQRMINDVEFCLGHLGAVFTAICNISQRMGRTERGGMEKLVSCRRAVPVATQAILRHLLILIVC
jgi:hypothetical protein